MDSYSILGQSAPGSQPSVPLLNSEDRISPAPSTSLRFPPEDNGKSLAEMAQRDLEAALQLLVERAQYITGASGAAIALREGSEMICRARAGSSAPELGDELQVDSGLTGESVRTRQLLRCDNTDHDSRVNRQSCRSLGIKSVMVVPLVRDQEAIGVFELLADRTNAFEDRDITALERLAEMILTALDHADAAKSALNQIAAQALRPPQNQQDQNTDREPEAMTLIGAEGRQISNLTSPADEADPLVVMSAAIAKLRECQACGFPVSDGRTLCLDCEASGQSSAAPAANSETPAFLSELATRRRQSWLQSHIYTIGTVAVAALTVVLLWLRLR